DRRDTRELPKPGSTKVAEGKEARPRAVAELAEHPGGVADDGRACDAAACHAEDRDVLAAGPGDGDEPSCAGEGRVGTGSSAGSRSLRGAGSGRSARQRPNRLTGRAARCTANVQGSSSRSVATACSTTANGTTVTCENERLAVVSSGSDRWSPSP